eukprot:bmy_21755T0
MPARTPPRLARRRSPRCHGNPWLVAWQVTPSSLFSIRPKPVIPKDIKEFNSLLLTQCPVRIKKPKALDPKPTPNIYSASQSRHFRHPPPRMGGSVCKAEGARFGGSRPECLWRWVPSAPGRDV